MPREHLAQTGEVVLHNIVEPVRDQNVIHIGEHIADFVVPSPHRPVETIRESRGLLVLLLV